MPDVMTRLIEDLLGRVGGPLAFRFVFQPAMAIIYATRDGLKDAREGRPAYFWSVFNSPRHRRELLRDGWKSVFRVFGLGITMDVIYQIISYRWIYPLEALIISFTLAILPYLLVRGPVNRIVRLLNRRPGAAGHRPSGG